MRVKSLIPDSTNVEIGRDALSTPQLGNRRVGLTPRLLGAKRPGGIHLVSLHVGRR